jgi:hypothetical protein
MLVGLEVPHSELSQDESAPLCSTPKVDSFFRWIIGRSWRWRLACDILTLIAKDADRVEVRKVDQWGPDFTTMEERTTWLLSPRLGGRDEAPLLEPISPITSLLAVDEVDSIAENWAFCRGSVNIQKDGAARHSTVAVRQATGIRRHSR